MPRTSVGLRGQAIFVDESAEDLVSLDPAAVGGHYPQSGFGRLLSQGPVWTVSIVVINEFGQDSLKVLGVDDQDLVQAFPPCGPHPSFRVCVRPRRPGRCLEHLDGVGGEDGVECGGELGVTVADEELERVDAVAEAVGAQNHGQGV